MYSYCLKFQTKLTSFYRIIARPICFGGYFLLGHTVDRQPENIRGMQNPTSDNHLTILAEAHNLA